eukprot:scaffold112796_cov62-Attheya_sp.AAC.2
MTMMATRLVVSSSCSSRDASWCVCLRVWWTMVFLLMLASSISARRPEEVQKTHHPEESSSSSSWVTRYLLRSKIFRPPATTETGRGEKIPNNHGIMTRKPRVENPLLRRRKHNIEIPTRRNYFNKDEKDETNTKLQRDGDLRGYLDLERGGRLKKYRLRNEVADYEFPFEYYVEFFGDLQLFNDTEKAELVLSFNESYALLNLSYSSILDLQVSSQEIKEVNARSRNLLRAKHNSSRASFNRTKNAGRLVAEQVLSLFCLVDDLRVINAPKSERAIHCFNL